MSNNPKVLVIDDSMPSLKLVSEILLYNGYDVIKTTSGKKGIIYALDYEPDLIIIDIVMPHIDGHKVLATIKSFDLLKNKHIIMMTSSNNIEDFKRSKEAGITDYLLKPISINGFVERVRKILPLENYYGVGAYLNGDNFVNEQDEDNNIETVLDDCEKILFRKKSVGRLDEVMDKSSSRGTKIEVIDGYPIQYVKLADLQPGMVPAITIKTKGGMTVHPAGVELTEKVIRKMQDFEFEDDSFPIRG